MLKIRTAGFVLLCLLASCKGFVAYPDQSGWSNFFLDRKGQIYADTNGQYRAQMKLEIYRPLPIGSRFDLNFEKFGSFGAANSVVTVADVTTYRFRSRVLPNYSPDDSVSIIVAVFEPGQKKALERIRVTLPFVAVDPEEGKRKKKKSGSFFPELSAAPATSNGFANPRPEVKLSAAVVPGQVAPSGREVVAIARPVKGDGRAKLPTPEVQSSAATSPAEKESSGREVVAIARRVGDDGQVQLPASEAPVPGLPADEGSLDVGVPIEPAVVVPTETVVETVKPNESIWAGFSDPFAGFKPAATSSKIKTEYK